MLQGWILWHGVTLLQVTCLLLTGWHAVWDHPSPPPAHPPSMLLLAAAVVVVP